MPINTMKAWDEARRAREAEPDNVELALAELKAEREHFKRVDRKSRYQRVIVYALVVIAFAFTAWRLSVLSQENHSLTTSLQSAIVESCEEIGNARAKVAREQIHEEIHDTEHPDPAGIEALDLPPEKLHELTAIQIEKLESRLSRVKITDCAAQYHFSP